VNPSTHQTLLCVGFARLLRNKGARFLWVRSRVRVAVRVKVSVVGTQEQCVVATYAVSHNICGLCSQRTMSRRHTQFASKTGVGTT